MPIIAVTAERADPTDVSAPPSAVPPPMPLPAMPPSAPARLPRLETMEAELLDEDELDVTTPVPLFPTLTAKAKAKATAPPPAMPPPDLASASTLAVPVGEFGAGATRVDADKLHVAHEQSTIKRDAAGAILGMAEHLTAVKPTPRAAPAPAPAPAPVVGEASGGMADATVEVDRVDATELGGASALVSSSATLRAGATLRRKRGVGGDVRYVATALFGVRRASRELVTLEGRQTSLLISRKRHLVTLGRAAVSAESLEHAALARAREELSDVEDERSQHTAQVQAADSELMRVRTDRNEAATAYAAAIAKLDTELSEITKKLEPLEKDVGHVAKRAAELRDSLQRVKQLIQDTESSLVSVKGQRLDRAAVTAEIATLKADREAIQRDEPVIASELDALNPRIAALEARRTEARRHRAELEMEETQDRKRTEELLTAIGAKRVVVDRAAGDAEVLRDKILLQLGESIYVDRIDDLRYELAPVDAIDMELATTDRRIMELQEILGSLDRWKLARGISVVVLAVAAVGSFAYWVAVNL